MYFLAHTIVEITVSVILSVNPGFTDKSKEILRSGKNKDD